MSYLYSKCQFDSFSLTRGDLHPPLAGAADPHKTDADHVIDAALRSVPLPEGMMTRLAWLAFDATDETADQSDYLGC